MSSFPIQTREFHNHHSDSTKWNDFPFRDDDIIVATAYKSGTTWTQNIIMQLIYQNKEMPADTASIAPWLDLRIPPISVQLPILTAITDRRQMKTHLRLDALNFSPKAKYIYIGRDGRDCYVSLVNHFRNMSDILYSGIESPGLIGPPHPRFDEELHNERVLFDRWISEGWPTNEGETDGYPMWSLFDHVASWWDYRHLSNIKFMHYTDMLNDTEGAIREIAAFLDIPIDEACMPHILEAVSLKHMKQHGLCVPPVLFKNGMESFVNQGSNGRWKGVLSEEQLAKYDAKVSDKLSPDCATWLAQGKTGYDPKSI